CFSNQRWRQHELSYVRTTVIQAHAQCQLKRVARLLRQNHRINESARGCELSVQLLLVTSAHALHLCFQLFVGLLTFLLQLLQLRSEHSLHSRVAFHHSHSSCRPTEDEVRIEALACHSVIARARCVIDCQDNLRHNCCRHSFNETRA